MGLVENQSKEPCEVSTTLAVNFKVEGSEQEKNDENGVEVVKSSVFDTEVSVHVLADSEVNNGVSALSKTGDSDGSVVCEKLVIEEKVKEVSVLSGDGLVRVDVDDRKDGNLKESEEGKKDENFDAKIANVEVNVKENESEEGKKDENGDGKIEIVDVPIVETSENVDVEVNGKENESEAGKKDENFNGKIEIVDVPIVETSENIDVEVNDLVCDFSVGDFVWGKIKSHPWWPGRVYDSSDASVFALKLKQKNRLLVAYFGDGTFAWCHPSQLKPFKDNFDDMARQSSSKVFTNAVQEAVNEVGRVLVMEMSRSFIVAEKTASELFAPVLAKNSGIKEGVLVPESGIERLSDVTIEPAELLSQVKQIAEIIDVASILELEILKAQLTAFYFSRGGFKLAQYEDPKRVCGLEDKDDVDSTVEVQFQGPSEEDYSTLPLSPKSGSRSNRRRKQKSIADIMEEDKDVDETDEVHDVIRSSGRKKRKGSDDAVTPTPVRKRKDLVIDTNGKSERARKAGRGGKENSDKGKSLRSNKKKEDSVDENSDKGKSLRSNKKKEDSSDENISSESKEEDDEGKSKEPNEKSFLSRERKKSKYLSPPFTTSIREPTRRRVEKEAKGAADQLSPRVSKRNSKAFQELELSNSLINQTQDEEKKTIDPEKVKVPSAEILSTIRNAAITPQISKEGSSFDRFTDFIVVMRSSLYHEGSLRKVYNKSQREKKRKKPESELGQSDQISHNEDSQPTKRRKETTPSVSKGKKKVSETKTVEKSIDEKSSGALLFVSFLPGSTLPSRSDLITIYEKFGALNEEETNMFRTNHTGRVSFLKTRDAEKALNHSQKKNPFESAEATFELQFSSSTGSMAGTEHSERSKSKSSKDKKKNKIPTPTIPPPSQGTEASKLNFVKHKLHGLVSMLESSDGKSPDFKTKVENEVKGLLDDVNKMV